MKMRTQEALQVLARAQRDQGKEIAKLAAAVGELAQRLEDPDVDLDVGSIAYAPDYRSEAPKVTEPGYYPPKYDDPPLPPPKPKTWAWKDLGGGNVEIAQPTGRQQLMRKAMLLDLEPILEHWTTPLRDGAQPIQGKDFDAAWLSGGPAWLYHYSRELVLLCPARLRRRMAEDIAVQSQEQAVDFARDVLKSEAELTGDADDPTMPVQGGDYSAQMSSEETVRGAR